MGRGVERRLTSHAFGGRKGRPWHLWKGGGRDDSVGALDRSGWEGRGSGAREAVFVLSGPSGEMVDRIFRGTICRLRRRYITRCRRIGVGNGPADGSQRGGRIGKDGAVRRQLRTLFNVGAIRELTDGQLLERFATDRSEAAELAFAVLVERHGPMVMRVCRAVLGDSHDSQDAFQATFLVLVKRARGLWVRDSIGPWLHQVAYRTATCARTTAARHRRLERQAAMSVEEARPERDVELERLLHEEMDRLPERYQNAFGRPLRPGRPHLRTGRAAPGVAGRARSRSHSSAATRARLRHGRLASPPGGVATDARASSYCRGLGSKAPGLAPSPCPAGFDDGRRGCDSPGSGPAVVRRRTGRLTLPRESCEP